MASLKDLRNRIKTVKSTERITSAMKMVAAAKLKKSEDRVAQSRPYANEMETMLAKLSAGMGSDAPLLLAGRGATKNKKILLLVITSDRGLCGGFNGTMVKETRKKIRALQQEGHSVSLMVVGRKGINLLRRDFAKNILADFEELCKPLPQFDGADMLAQKIIALFNAGEIDECQLFYTKYVSALTQVVTPLSLIPFQAATASNDNQKDNKKPVNEAKTSEQSVTEFDPDEEAILAKLLPQNLAVQVYRGLLESFASEQGARMTAMDNATRNAKDMINKLTITYNRSRQAQITKELIEIISGAEAV
ncbi:MAG: F0F1 ATP synthase subunit gamma [Hydrotalea sp.]|nr:F0F1 ATP synthase subunit gamma [Hydrotalea sp.]